MAVSTTTCQQLLVVKTASATWTMVQKPNTLVVTATPMLLQKAHSSLRCGGDLPVNYTSRTGCNPNFITSEALRMLERACKPFMPPRKPPPKLTIMGAGSAVGQITSLLMKQQKVLQVMAMYDDAPDTNVLGVATDLGHIDTSTIVHAYHGRSYLKAALHNTDVVLICGGTFLKPPFFNLPDRDLFHQNLRYVRSAAMAVAQFAPDAIVVLQTPPLDANFTLFKHTLKQFHAYDKRRLIGLASVSSMRANQMFVRAAGGEPEDSYVPVIGGTGRCTRVPVLSGTKNFFCLPKNQLEFIPRLVREADDLICRVKSNGEQGHLSIGFAAARCLVNVLNGVMGKPSFIDSAFVEQAHPQSCYNMKYCSTPITVGPHGITEYHIPKLTDVEKQTLDEIKCDLDDMLNLGRCNAVGDEYELHPCKICPCCYLAPCPTCLPVEQEDDHRMESRN